MKIPPTERPKTPLPSRTEASPSVVAAYHLTTKGTPSPLDFEELIAPCTGEDVDSPLPAQTREPDLTPGDGSFSTITPPTTESPIASCHSIARAVFRKGSHYQLRPEETYFVEEGVATVRTWNPATPHQIKERKVVKGKFIPLYTDKARKLISDEDCTLLIIASPSFTL